MFSFRELFFVYIIGSIMYGIIEVIFRGYTHWSMILTGGACFLLFYLLNFSLNMNLLQKCLLSMFIITSLEFVVGYFVNIVFGLNVWNYTELPFNYMGLVCPLYSGIWFLFGIPMTFLASFIRAELSVDVPKSKII